MKRIKKETIIQSKMIIPLLWSHKITEIDEGGIKKTRDANAEECKALAMMLDLVDCASLTVNYSIEPLGSGWRAYGDLKAHVTQSCVISLEPVEDHLSEAFEVEFQKISSPKGETAEEHKILDSEDLEYLEEDQINIGRIIYDTLSTAINPYPRKDGAEFLWQNPQLKNKLSSNGPFMLLKKLKPDD